MKRSMVNEFALILEKKEVDEVIPHAVAVKYLELLKKGKIPNWVLDLTDTDKMKLAAIEV